MELELSTLDFFHRHFYQIFLTARMELKCRLHYNRCNDFDTSNI
jgi:hypothetical protein